MKVRKRCKIPGCLMMAVARGLCEMHWQRWRAWGDPLIATRKEAAAHLAGLFK